MLRDEIILNNQQNDLNLQTIQQYLRHLQA